MRVRTRVRRFSVHVRKCTYVQNVLPRNLGMPPLPFSDNAYKAFFFCAIAMLSTVIVGNKDAVRSQQKYIFN